MFYNSPSVWLRAGCVNTRCVMVVFSENVQFVQPHLKVDYTAAMATTKI